MESSPTHRRDQPNWLRIKELFVEATRINREERTVWIEGVCVNSPDIELELKSLLQHYDPDDQFLESPVEFSGFRAPGLGDTDNLTEFVPGSRIKSWRILRKLGSGGMGNVYFVERTEDDDENCK